jgi:hypothetical protein
MQCNAQCQVHENVLAYGDNGLKSDFGGHDEVGVRCPVPGMIDICPIYYTHADAEA